MKQQLSSPSQEGVSGNTSHPRHTPSRSDRRTIAKTVGAVVLGIAGLFAASKEPPRSSSAQAVESQRTYPETALENVKPGETLMNRPLFVMLRRRNGEFKVPFKIVLGGGGKLAVCVTLEDGVDEDWFFDAVASELPTGIDLHGMEMGENGMVEVATTAGTAHVPLEQCASIPRNILANAQDTPKNASIYVALHVPRFDLPGPLQYVNKYGTQPGVGDEMHRVVFTRNTPKK